jgi:hypothetical protein
MRSCYTRMPAIEIADRQQESMTVVMSRIPNVVGVPTHRDGLLH